ncbi:hypothetical protein [Zestomonas carbonaria]|uniref:Uncharacterized protein n=1 Tax=Zestomonas carbonaria TaxID=2762745 RepID=A0A7U7ELL2_9GAMM|nr:hypothetical protein [Pseudomonas carbonaria]CAD5106858.1 hypothetical protein PSEWESI4_01125 [Pseudomonas carbonaria]
MSLQLLWGLFQAHPAQLVNGLALFFAVAGGWLLVATRTRERRALARLTAQTELAELDEEEALPLDERTLRINRFFTRFGAASLGLALVVSWLSTQLV